MTATSTSSKRRMAQWWTAASLVLFSSVGCSGIQVPDLGSIYEAAAHAHGPGRNPVVVIPGFLGSKLKVQKTGQVGWGAFTGDYADPETAEGARLIAFPMEHGTPLSGLRDELVTNGVLDTVKLSIFGLPINAKAYANVLGLLGAGGYRDEELGESGAIDYGKDHYTCYQFPYDFRRDITESARQLHEFLLAKRALVQAEVLKRFDVERPGLKFDVVAHSMGGLVLRWYLRYGAAELPADGSLPKLTWAGAELIERAIVVGTPNFGSASSILGLVRGEDLGAFLPEYSASILGSFPALYQLMPRSRHGTVVDDRTGKPIGDLFDPALWTRLGWGLASPNAAEDLEELLPHLKSAAERRKVAVEHQAKCLRRAKQVLAALDVPAPLPSGLALYLFAGDAEPTNATIRVESKTGEIVDVETVAGDGTVTRGSALGDERVGSKWKPGLRSPIPWTSVTFVHSDHLGLTKDKSFSDNVLFLLLEKSVAPLSPAPAPTSRPAPPAEKE